MKKKPNILVILCDQLRADFLSCYSTKGINTPNIDSIVKDGVLFRGATTASPVCAPGRACMMTGRYVSDHGVWTNDVPFKDGIEFLPSRVTEAGYKTGCFGKLHHYPPRDSKGFQECYQMEENRMGEQDDYYKFLKDNIPEVKSIFPKDSNGNFAYPEKFYYENFICKKALEFMENVSNEESFFAWVSFQGPHGPIDPPKEILNENEDRISPLDDPKYIPSCEVPRYRKSRGDSYTISQQMEYRKGYCKLIKEIDNKVGCIINYLKESNRYEDTLIIFSADHGDMCGDYNMRQKGPFIYSPQLEIPFIIANHPNLPKYKESNMLISNLDIAATILKLCGSKEGIGYSRDIAEMYSNEELQRKSIYSEFCDSMKVITTKEFRFAYYPFSGECELVNLKDEKVNLSDDPKYSHIKNKFLMDIIDFMIVAKGVHIEAQDLTPKVQNGLKEKLPNYKDKLELVFPIASNRQRENLLRDGLNTDYNEFCKTRKVIKFYSKYWD